MKNWNNLKEGDIVDIIAPSSGSFINDEVIKKVCCYLESINLVPRISPNMYKTKDRLTENGQDPFCANTDEIRFTNLVDAINSDSKAIWAIKGGYGASRLIDQLEKIEVPENSKLFIGFSDITVLHLFFQQKWQWPTIHGELLFRLINQDQKNKDLIEHIVFNPKNITYTDFIAFNEQATIPAIIEAPITGGNLCLIESSIGTSWQIDCKDKILFLEEVDERGYRVDRSLEHLYQSGIVNGAKAIILGEFTPGYENDGSNYIDYALDRFVSKLDIPVIRANVFGHNDYNYPLPFGTECNLILGDYIELNCTTGAIS